MHDFSGKTVIVTGGAGGIGGAAAVAFARVGAEVIATGFGEDELAGRRDDPDFAGIRLIELDVTSDEAVADLAARTPKLDVLVNCAGVSIRGANCFTIAAFQKNYDVNMLGTLRMCNAFLPQLEASGAGAVINIASVNAFNGTPTAPGYAASKGAVALATKSMAIAWAPQNVRVNAVAPGWIETPMSRDAASSPEFYERIVKRTPMGRWGEPRHLAGPILFLASPDAEWVTGVILPVDGGYLAV